MENNIIKIENIIKEIEKKEIDVYQREALYQKLADSALNKLILTDNDKLMNLAALTSKVLFFRKHLEKDFFMYCKTIKNIFQYNKYKEQYNTKAEYCQKVLKSSYRSVKEQLDVFEGYADYLRSTAGSIDIGYSKLSQSLPLLNNPDLTENQKKKIKDDVFEMSKNKSQREIKEYIKEVKKKYVEQKSPKRGTINPITKYVNNLIDSIDNVKQPLITKDFIEIKEDAERIKEAIDKLNRIKKYLEKLL